MSAQLGRAAARLLALGGADAAASRTTAARGGQVHHRELGAGPPLVLLHGAAGGGANWYRLLRPLATCFRVLAPDLPGFGFSDPVEPAPPLAGRMADRLADWLDALGLARVGLAGTSFGGLVALRLAQRRPRGVSRLALLGAAGLGRDVTRLLRLAALPGVGPAALRPSRRATRQLLRRRLTAGTPLEPEHESALVDYLVSSAAATGTALLARGVRASLSWRGQREVLSDAELAAVAPPTLVVWGERDRMLPRAHGERAASCIPRAVLCVLPGAGHSPNWEAPDVLLGLLLPFFSEGG